MAFKGHDCTVGIVANLTRPPPTENAGLVDFVQSLGAVPFCRTNLAQTCISFDSSNPIFGATIHPKDPTRSPGGSSGGEGALVAAGGSIMGFGKLTNASLTLLQPLTHCQALTWAAASVSRRAFAAFPHSSRRLAGCHRQDRDQMAAWLA